jgi:hypothetical protein
LLSTFHARYPNTMPYLNYQSISDSKTSYREYAQFLKDRLECVGQEVIRIETKNQLVQAEEQATKVTMPNEYAVETIVYLLAPTIPELVTSSKKIVVSYIGPLVIREIVSRDKALLSDLEGKKIHGLYHFKR